MGRPTVGQHVCRARAGLREQPTQLVGWLVGDPTGGSWNPGTVPGTNTQYTTSWSTAEPAHSVATNCVVPFPFSAHPATFRTCLAEEECSQLPDVNACKTLYKEVPDARLVATAQKICTTGQQHARPGGRQSACLQCASLCKQPKKRHGPRTPVATDAKRDESATKSGEWEEL